MDSGSGIVNEGKRRYLEIEADIIALPADEQLPRALKRIRFLEAVRAEDDRRSSRGAQWYDTLLDFAFATLLMLAGMWAYSKGADSMWFCVFLGIVLFLAGGRVRRWWV